MLPVGVMTEWLSVVIAGGWPGTGIKQAAPLVTMAPCSTDEWLPATSWPVRGEVVAAESVAGAVSALVAASPTKMIAPLTDVTIFFMVMSLADTIPTARYEPPNDADSLDATRRSVI